MSLLQNKKLFQHCSVTGSFTYMFHPDLYKRTCSFHKRTKTLLLSTSLIADLKRFILVIYTRVIGATIQAFHAFLRIILQMIHVNKAYKLPLTYTKNSNTRVDSYHLCMGVSLVYNVLTFPLELYWLVCRIAVHSWIPLVKVIQTLIE